MGDVSIHHQKIKVEYQKGSEEMEISLHGNESYSAKIDEMILDTRIANIKNLTIKKNFISIDFSAPVEYNPKSNENQKTVMYGVQVVGEDKNIINSKIEHLAKNLGDEWARSVRLTKEEILKRKWQNNIK